jgi:hypothetical protein
VSRTSAFASFCYALERVDCLIGVLANRAQGIGVAFIESRIAELRFGDPGGSPGTCPSGKDSGFHASTGLTGRT